MSNIRKLIKTSAFALCFFGFIPSSKALDSYCEALPDCKSLGYEENLECPQGTYITCPYNVSFKKCVNASCEDLGYTLTNKTGWCKNVVYCPTDSSYTLCAVKCSACPSGELNPTCDYGTSPSSVDDCGHQCYVCKACNLDEVSGWTTANTECNFSQYVQKEIMPVCPQNAGGAKKYICGSCPTGTVAPAKNSTSCMCNEAAGYYATCPAGASCKPVSTAFGNCYKPEKGAEGDGGDADGDGCDESQGWVLNSSTDTHFIYDEVSTFNINGTAVTCKRAVGCNAASDASTNKPSDISDYFATSNKTIGSVKCYWVTGCKSPHATTCSEARTLSNAQTKGSFTCGDCICNEANGYYATEQEGYSSTMVDGCYKVESNCVDPYTANTSDDHFTYGVNGVCTKVTGCRFATQGSVATNNYDTSYFDVKEVTNGGQKCYYVNGCKTPKVEASACTDGQKHTNTKTAYNGGYTCGTCECNESKGYYNSCPTGAACEKVGSCYKTVRGGNGDEDNNGCKESDGYVPSTVTDSHFNFGSTVSFKIGSSTITCKLVTGCNSATAASTENLSSIGSYFATTNRTLGKKTCHWVTGCQTPYADDCSEARKLNNSQTKGGFTCGTCECNEDKGYYNQCPAGQTCTNIDGCQNATGCANNYTTNTTDSHFTYGPELENTSCREVTGCDSSKAGSTKTKSDINAAYFDINNNGNGKTVGTTTCYWITGCKSPYKSECSESKKLDNSQTKGGFTCGTCICDENNGYYDTCPTGQSCTNVDGCQSATGCADNYTTNTSDTHFTYGSAIAGTTCREVTGCNSSADGSTKTKSNINTTYFTINNNGNGKTVGTTTCYWITGCQSGYGNTCPTGKKLTGTPSPQGGFTCQSCECDEANGYYKNVPTGQTYEVVNGCYHLTGGCSNPYTANTSDNHFTYGPADTCTEVTGCNSSQDGSTAQNTYNSTYFDVKSVSNGGWVCYYTNSCKSPYVSSCSATGQKLSNTQTAYSGGPTCGTCVCDTSNGYYSIGSCPESLVCTTVGECEDADATCNASNGYYDSNTDEHFAFGSAVSKTVASGTNKTCYKVTGCNTAKDYISGACPAGTSAYNEDTKGGFTCHKCGSCVPPAGSAASGECPTGYKSSTTVTGECGGITYYACECDSNNGYYTQSQKEATAGVTFNTHANTGYPTCYTFASCAAGWSAESDLEDLLIGNVFATSARTLGMKKTNGTTENCYQISGCESPYVNRVCTSAEQQFGQSYVAPNNSSVTCRDCRTIPSCALPWLCNYVTTSVSNGSVVYNFDSISFNSDLSAYNSCMGYFTKTAGCSDIGASPSASGSITAPNGAKCAPNESSCGVACNSSLASDATTTKPTPEAGYNYDSVSTSDGTCYYNISPKTCSEQTSNAYPYETQQTCSSTQASRSSSSMYYIGASQIYCWSGCQDLSCSELYADGTRSEPGDGYNYSTDTVAGSYCYHDITVKTCNEQSGGLYPNNSSPSCTSPRVYNMSPSTYLIGSSYQYCYSRCYCDESEGWYGSRGSAAFNWTCVTGRCCSISGCADGWIASDDANFAAFSTNGSETVNLPPLLGSVPLTCYHANGCAEGKVKRSDCDTTTHTFSNSATAGIYTCGDCTVNCNDTCGSGNFASYPYATEEEASANGGYATTSLQKCDGGYCYARGSANTCPAGYETSAAACGENFALGTTVNGKSGDSDCKNCQCASNACINQTSQGRITECLLVDPCEGYDYDYEHPTHGHGIGNDTCYFVAKNAQGYCFGKTTRYKDFECDTGYHKDGTSCVANTCANPGDLLAAMFDGACPSSTCGTCTETTITTPDGEKTCHTLGFFRCNRATCTTSGRTVIGEDPTCTLVDACPTPLPRFTVCYSGMKATTVGMDNYTTLNVVTADGTSCGTCYKKTEGGGTGGGTTCASGTYEKEAACVSANSSSLQSGETCTKIGNCYKPYCTKSLYSSMINKAILMRWTLQSCSGSTQCRPRSDCLINTGVNSSEDLDGKYHYYGSYSDGCLPYRSGGVDVGDTRTAKEKCEDMLAYNQEFLDEWNNKCSNDISVTYYGGSASNNCSYCILGQNAALARCINPE